MIFRRKKFKGNTPIKHSTELSYDPIEKMSLDELIQLAKSNYGTGRASGSNIHITNALNWPVQDVVVGGGAISQNGTPSIDNEVPFVYTTGTQEIVDRNKNFFKVKAPDYTQKYAYDGYGNSYYTIENQSIILGDGFSSIAWAFNSLKVGQKYTFSATVVAASNCNALLGLNKHRGYSGSNTATKTVTANATPRTVSITFTADDDCRLTIAKANTVDIVTFSNIQLEEGSVATNYIAYKEPIKKTLHLGDIYLGIKNNRKNYFRRVAGKWYWHKEWHIRTITGNENWILNANGYFQFYLGGVINPNAYNSLSNYFAEKHTSLLATEYGMYTRNTSNLYIGFPNKTLAEFKEWFASNNTQIAYNLKNSTDIEITSTNYPELYEDLQQIDEIQTYRDDTIIEITSENGNPAELEITYIKDNMEDRVATLEAKVALLE